MTGKEFNILMSPHRVSHWMQVFSCSQVSGACAHLTYRVGEVCSAVHLCQLLWSRWILRRGQLIWICRVVSPDNNNHSVDGVRQWAVCPPGLARDSNARAERSEQSVSREAAAERERVWHVMMWGVTRVMTDPEVRGSAEDNNIIWWRWSRSRDTVDIRGVRPQCWTMGRAEERV